MGKNLKNQTGYKNAASGSTPAGTKTMSPAPGGGKVKMFSGPSIHNKRDCGNLKNCDGIDGGTSVISR